MTEPALEEPLTVEELTQQAEMANAGESDLELPEWFTPEELIVSKHSIQRFLERVYPNLNPEDAKTVLKEVITEVWWTKGLMFYRSYTTDSWLARVKSDKFNIEFLAAFTYKDLNDNHILDNEDVPLLATVLPCVPPKYKVLNQNLLTLNQKLKKADEDIKSLKAENSKLRQQLKNAEQRKLVAEEQQERAEQLTEMWRTREEWFEKALYNIFIAEKSRGKSSSKRQIQRLYFAISEYYPEWGRINDCVPFEWKPKMKEAQNGTIQDSE